jgi:hypothetical protein
LLSYLSTLIAFASGSVLYGNTLIFREAARTVLFAKQDLYDACVMNFFPLSLVSVTEWPTL